jgi:hypothetical protein
MAKYSFMPQKWRKFIYNLWIAVKKNVKNDKRQNHDPKLSAYYCPKTLKLINSTYYLLSVVRNKKKQLSIPKWRIGLFQNIGQKSEWRIDFLRFFDFTNSDFRHSDCIPPTPRYDTPLVK